LDHPDEGLVPLPLPSLYLLESKIYEVSSVVLKWPARLERFVMCGAPASSGSKIAIRVADQRGPWVLLDEVRRREFGIELPRPSVQGGETVGVLVDWRPQRKRELRSLDMFFLMRLEPMH